MKEREPRGKGVGKWIRRLQSGRGEMQRRLDIESLRRRGDHCDEAGAQELWPALS